MVKKKSSETKKIEVKKLQMNTVIVQVRGITPLVVHAWTNKAIGEMIAKQMHLDLFEQKAAKDPQQDYEQSLYKYVDEKGTEHWGFPATGFKAAMYTANSDLKKAKLSKLDGTTFRRACFILADGTEQRRIVIRLKDPDATETTPKAKAYIEQTFTQATDLIEVVGDPRMRMDMVRIGMQKTPDVRFRPEFVEWSATLRIEYNTDVLTEEIIGNLLYRAGLTVGIGEGRADLGWGRFEIVAGGGK